jgi:hypothetical protein
MMLTSDSRTTAEAVAGVPVTNAQKTSIPSVEGHGSTLFAPLLREHHMCHLPLAFWSAPATDLLPHL